MDSPHASACCQAMCGGRRWRQTRPGGPQAKDPRAPPSCQGNPVNAETQQGPLRPGHASHHHVVGTTWPRPLLPPGPSARKSGDPQGQQPRMKMLMLTVSLPEPWGWFWGGAGKCWLLRMSWSRGRKFPWLRMWKEPAWLSREHFAPRGGDRDCLCYLLAELLVTATGSCQLQAGQPGRNNALLLQGARTQAQGTLKTWPLVGKQCFWPRPQQSGGHGL